MLVNIYDIEIAHGIEGVGRHVAARRRRPAGRAASASALSELGFQVVREQ